MLGAKDSYISPGSLVELDLELVSLIWSDSLVQAARPPDRVQRDSALHTSTSDGNLLLGMLCADLSFCPNGFSFEIKPKLGVADCGVPECGVDGVPRFTMLQCIDFPKKKPTLSKYNPISLFEAVIQQRKVELRRELSVLRDASRDLRQNNFRLLGREACEASKAPDAALDDLCEVGQRSMFPLPEGFLTLRFLQFPQR